MQDTPEASGSLKQIAKHSAQIFFSFDVETNSFIYLNPAFEQVLKRTRKSVAANASSLLESIHLSDREYLIKQFQKIIQGEIIREIEFRIVLPDNSERWLRLNAFLDDEAPGKTVILGYAEDFTEWKHKEEYTRKYSAKKDSVLEILAHDLAGPLNNIKMASSFIEEITKKLDHPELDKMIAIISKTSERSIQLIREFVAQEFLETTSVEVTKKRVDMVKNLKEVVDQYQASEEQLGKKFSFRSSHEKVFIKVDDVKFRQAINNLISNAIKFTPDGGKIALEIEDKQDTVLFTVADNGIGIPTQYHDTLFTKFTKARRRGLKGEPSTGLGMSIIKTIIEWHGGSIWFESQENSGTKFFIEMPKE